MTKNYIPVNMDGEIIDPLIRKRVNAYVEQLKRMTELVHEQEIEIEELRAQLKALCAGRVK